MSGAQAKHEVAAEIAAPVLTGRRWAFLLGAYSLGGFRGLDLQLLSNVPALFLSDCSLWSVRSGRWGFARLGVDCGLRCRSARGIDLGQQHFALRQAPPIHDRGFGPNDDFAGIALLRSPGAKGRRAFRVRDGVMPDRSRRNVILLRSLYRTWCRTLRRLSQTHKCRCVAFRCGNDGSAGAYPSSLRRLS